MTRMDWNIVQSGLKKNNFYNMLIEIPKFILRLLPQRLLNSFFYHNVYYKHTRKHKKDLKDTRDRVLAVRKKAIGK